MLTSCSLIDKLGFDTYDYMSERVVTTHDVESDLAKELSSTLEVLITDSVYLETFENMGEAIKEYRDAVLTYMLKTNYLKYSGNTEMIEKAAEQYPEYKITQIIPQSDFEATMYRLFGGDVKITHKDGDKFKYLSKTGAYISPVVPESIDISPEITYIGETMKTYRVNFIVKTENAVSDEYFALIIKRTDGTLYIKKLLMAQ